jgi:guanine nucleotide-binding protein G(I)/G(S)/G(T) subunit beta-1
MSVSDFEEEINGLKKQIKSASEDKSDTSLSKVAKKKDLSNFEMPNLKLRRSLKGHIAKVLEFDFCENQADLIVSASQDGKLIVWNGLSTNKLFVIPLKSQWVLSCGFSPGGSLVGCGGLDNSVYLYRLSEDKTIPDESIDLKGHEGSISKVRFYDDEHVISCSGDRSAILWNIDGQNVEQQFWGHLRDVLCVDSAPDKHLILTGSIDCSAMLWDRRNGEAVLSFTGHDSDINTIKFFPNKTSFLTASDDGTMRLFDLRGDRELMVYTQPDKDNIFKVASATFSSSGKYIFSACHQTTYVWNALSGEIIGNLDDDDIVSCVGVNPNGRALFTASWKNIIKVYA